MWIPLAGQPASRVQLNGVREAHTGVIFWKLMGALQAATVEGFNSRQNSKLSDTNVDKYSQACMCELGSHANHMRRMVKVLGGEV